jgi:hypothetical protein
MKVPDAAESGHWEYSMLCWRSYILMGPLIIDILPRLPSPNPVKSGLARSKAEFLEVPFIF